MKFDDTSSEGSSESTIVDLASFRRKKEMTDELSRGRRPLYVSHLEGRIRGEGEEKEETRDFGDRLTRIRSSLDKINRLMGELKKISHDADDSSNRRGSLDRRK